MKKKYRKCYALLFMLLIIAAVTLHPRTTKADEKGISIRKSKVTLYVGADKVTYRRFIMSPKLSGISGAVKYKTSSKKIAKVNSKGYVYAVSPGTAVVIAYLKDNGKLYTARCKVVVKKPEIVFGQDQLDLKVGESTNISWNLTPPGTIKWSVRNGKRVSVDSNGMATGLKAGGTFIYAEANGVKKRLLVKVAADENQPVVTPTPTPTPTPANLLPEYIKAGNKYEYCYPYTWGSRNFNALTDIEITKVDGTTIWLNYSFVNHRVIHMWVKDTQSVSDKAEPLPVILNGNSGSLRIKNTYTEENGTAILAFYPDKVQLKVDYDSTTVPDEDKELLKVDKFSVVYAN